MSCAPLHHVDHFIPGLAVSRTSAGASTQLALTYYFDTNPSCSYEKWFTDTITRLLLG